jgi:hypothetical protein
MVYERRQPRRSADDRLVDRLTRRETAAQRARRLARKRIDVPEEVIIEFERRLNKDTVREARAIAQELTHSPAQETRAMTSKRKATTKRAEPTPTTTKPEPKAKATAKPKAAKKAAAKKKAAKPTDRASMLAAYMADKLKIQKGVKIGAVIVYHRRNETIDGKSVKVVEYESRGGIWVEFRAERYVVSPHALLKKADVEKKS